MNKSVEGVIAFEYGFAIEKAQTNPLVRALIYRTM